MGGDTAHEHTCNSNAEKCYSTLYFSQSGASGLTGGWEVTEESDEKKKLEKEFTTVSVSANLKKSKNIAHIYINLWGLLNVVVELQSVSLLFHQKCKRIYECYQIMLGGSEELQSEAASWPAGCSLPPPPFTPSSQAAATATPANATHKSSFIDQ